ncbi:NGG1p interacting factor NIF3 [archaeon SCG-AAA382B04]|nr:NGG1p interacting factor NIF3 [archaeon SCG-AAA382B04]
MVKLKKLHEFAVQEGIKQDPRDQEQIENQLEKRKEEFEDLEGVRKEEFDENKLENPFDDSKVLNKPDADVQKIAFGIDIETQDLLLLDKLNKNKENIDAVITHHPDGRALSNLYEVMKLQIDVLENAGVPISQAEAVVKGRVKEVMRGVHGGNLSRTPKAAELLDFPYMCLHTVADNHAHQFLKSYLENENPYTLKDLMDSLIELPEFAWSLEYGMGPTIFNGDEENRVGKIAYDMTGGTELNKDRLEKMAQSGINTIVAMHMSQSQVDEAGEQNINVVSAGHMPSDSLGINLLMDKAIQEFDLEVMELSGFKRVSRI